MTRSSYTQVFNMNGEHPRYIHTCRIKKIKNLKDGRCEVTLARLKNKRDDLWVLAKYTTKLKQLKKEIKNEK